MKQDGARLQHARPSRIFPPGGHDTTIRVAIIADGMPSGGTERQIVALLKGLRQSCRSIETLFGVLVKGGAREHEAMLWANEVLPIRQQHQLDITLAWSVVRLVRRYRVDVVHTFGSIADLAGCAASRMAGAKFVNGSIRSARRKLSKRDRLSKLTMPFADLIVANSRAGLRAFGMDKLGTARVIYNGMDLASLSGVGKIDFPAPFICMVGNFTAKKDQKALIEAFPLVLKQHPDYRLVLIGRGDRETHCRQVIDRLGLIDRVVIVNDCDEPAPWIEGATVCVLLSPDGEGLSNVIMEYCAHGKPVVATDLGGNDEIIEDGASGVLLQSHDSDTVGSALLALLNDKEKMERIGRRAGEIIQERFHLQRMIDDYVELYFYVVKKK
ncbi:glycosyltransferase [Desulfofustis glycolicus]|uniref:Glycosyltransferase involved in cell wall bisynthesis n=1 Tax=Desulfofustis glycolicus DSM 9705 TaxID=1121409 RepID=A0A1M5Y8F5_9BACT|nr:glycosyltransferase [Desulfofustis glycolicus]MCB2216865.1 glycosyltransferase [Desulfobulbaceae bacterium]SHI07763.1 Glycosyltransferase involved in cell wall bisynthesis [Desulfofustis glycolicus DSM 9705]